MVTTVRLINYKWTTWKSPKYWLPNRAGNGSMGQMDHFSRCVTWVMASRHCDLWPIACLYTWPNNSQTHTV